MFMRVCLDLCCLVWRCSGCVRYVKCVCAGVVHLVVVGSCFVVVMFRLCVSGCCALIVA